MDKAWDTTGSREGIPFRFLEGFYNKLSRSLLKPCWGRLYLTALPHQPLQATQAPIQHRPSLFTQQCHPVWHQWLSLLDVPTTMTDVQGSCVHHSVAPTLSCPPPLYVPLTRSLPVISLKFSSASIRPQDKSFPWLLNATRIEPKLLSRTKDPGWAALMTFPDSLPFFRPPAHGDLWLPHAPGHPPDCRELLPPPTSPTRLETQGLCCPSLLFQHPAEHLAQHKCLLSEWAVEILKWGFFYSTVRSLRVPNETVSQNWWAIR